MSASLVERLRAAVSGGVLEERLEESLEPLLAARRGDAALGALQGPILAGLARVIGARPEEAGFLGHRPALLARIAAADAVTLESRARELAAWRPSSEESDLEGILDELRLLRREETSLAACIAQAGLVPFPEVSTFLSVVAETITARALELARRGTTPHEFAVLGMGKIAGREFTYHSDLDLVFLYEGGPETVADASRVGQRLISYLTTMTGAGVAYAVDARLRPSGRQGMLVTSLAAFERYQCDQAQTWEHVAMLRARAIAGSIEPAAATLDRVRRRVLPEATPCWRTLGEIRQRVELERSSGDATIPFKTGAGGLMDVDFLAGGALLERGAPHFPELPAVPALLRAVARGRRVEELLEDYAFLRRVEAAARWAAGRSVEGVASDPATLGTVAELTAPELSGQTLHDALLEAMARIRSAYDRVVEADSIAALET